MTYFCFKPSQNNEEPTSTRVCPRGRIAFSFVLAALLMTVGIFYLWQINSFVSQTYNIEQLKKDEQVLTTEEQELFLALANLRSLKNLKQETLQLSLVEVQQVSYLSLSEPLALAGTIND